MSIWRGYDIADAFGVADEGLVLHGAFCLNTPLGYATPSLYRGNPDFLEWLGSEIPRINTRLGRLSISRLLEAKTGRYYTSIADDMVILSTLESGPSCDPHNAFELFTVAAGVAHVHQQLVPAIGNIAFDWLAYYQAQADKLRQLRPESLSKRAHVAWSNLEETWRLCVEEAIDMLNSLKSKPTSPKPCLVLGLQSFSDFVYLADRHQVHYNSVANCHFGSPTIDIARLIISASGETRIAHNMLLSYQRVRELSENECKEILAHLWFPHELDLESLADCPINTLILQRAANQLQEKIGMISELEDILLTPEEEPEVMSEKEVLDVAKKPERTPAKKEQQEVLEVVTTPEPKAEVEQQVVEQTVGEELEVKQVEEPEAAKAEAPLISVTATAKKKATVWGPFPTPLGEVADTSEDLIPQGTTIELDDAQVEEDTSNPV